AEHGNINPQKDGSQVVTLDKGTRFEGTALLRDFRITDFNNYKALIGHRAVAVDNTQSEQMSMKTLWQSDDPDACAEFHWRLTLVVSVVLMALLVVPL
ncbi:MAG: LptF/LptG family permease, partial [Serratia symbiotica]|nr:LptF/LptG family permease [Serratia symbiotica]